MSKTPLPLLLLWLLAGCTTVVKYQPKTAAGPAKPADYPIYIYPERVQLPRPCEIIGTMHVGDTPFTVFGGTLEGVLNTLRKNARQEGADALQLTVVKSPEFQTPHFRADANFLRFSTPWEAIASSQEEMLAYLRTNASKLDPIEGIWFGNDPVRSRVGIVKNNSKPGRDFVAFIINTRNPSWQKGDKKIDLVRGERAGVYRGEYYLDDYEGKRIAFSLRVPPGNRFVIQTAEDSTPIIFTRE
jgi:hypothetical protein